MADTKFTPDQLIREQTLKERLEEIGQDEVEIMVLGMPGGYAVHVVIGEKARVLATSRGAVRLFATLDTVARFMGSIGYSVFEVDMTAYKPGRLRGPRPDRKAALVRGNAKE